MNMLCHILLSRCTYYQSVQGNDIEPPRPCEIPWAKHVVDKTDVYEKLSVMLEKEKDYRCHDCLRGCNDKPAQDGSISVSSRSQVCEWMFRTVDQIEGSEPRSETAAIAMSLLDRYLWRLRSKGTTLESEGFILNLRCYKLAAVACLCIALKMSGLRLSKSTLCRLSGCYSVAKPFSVECHILSSLRWRLNGPTALQFVHHFLELLRRASSMSSLSMIYTHSRLQTELAVANYSLVGLDRSTIAIASILNSISQVDVHVHEITQYLAEISCSIGIRVDSPSIYAARGRLLDCLASQAYSDIGQVSMFKIEPQGVESTSDCSAQLCVPEVDIQVESQDVQDAQAVTSDLPDKGSLSYSYSAVSSDDDNYEDDSDDQLVAVRYSW